MNSTSFIILLSSMLALRIILQLFSIIVPGVGFKISISWLPIYVIGFLFGPFVGLVFGALSDTFVYLIYGGVWFWMYAIQEPVVGLISGICGSLFFLNQKNNWLLNILWRIIIYGFVFYCVINVLNNLSVISKDTFQGAKSTSNELIFSIVISALLFMFLIVLESLNFIFYKKNKNKSNTLFLYISITVSINIMLFSFILGPSIQLSYLQYLGNPPPTGFLKNGVIYLLIPRILKECIKTPLYIVLLFSIIYALKTQYINLLNIEKNKWHKTYNRSEKLNTITTFFKQKVYSKQQLNILLTLYNQKALSLQQLRDILCIINISGDLQLLITQQLIVFNNKNKKYEINEKIMKILSNI